jgi:predicted metal-dependent hydrolase
MDERINNINEKALDATEKFLDRRALIFIEEAIAHYNGRFGVKETRRYLKYMLDYLEEFEK